ncbi:MAG: UDP-N-acetylmuramoyl-L-alanine--D-glutamate ligase [Acidimicrobiales bacterium]
MSRPTGFAELARQRVGIFGFGVEGRAAATRLRGLSELVIVDDKPVDPEVITTSDGGHEALLSCDVVLKSPGIPRRRDDILDLERHGVYVTSALNLWLHDVDRTRVVAVTGTKGKSTTTALITFFLRALGEQAQYVGNIGLAPYDPTVDTSTGWIVLEVSSFQCVDLDVAPTLIAVTSLGEDHVDWHGSLEQYRRDKLSFTRALGEHRTFVCDSDILRRYRYLLGGDVHFVSRDEQQLSRYLGLLGAHNDDNVGLALEVVCALTGVDGDELRRRIRQHEDRFVPLRGRLTYVGSEERDGALLRYVDDGLATSALPSIAALRVFDDVPVALIAGGYDRGVEYHELARALAERHEPTIVVTLGGAGQRIAAALSAQSTKVGLFHATTMGDAIEIARSSLRHGVVLLSPAAPSFDLYRNWEERSEDFTSIARTFINT